MKQAQPLRIILPPRLSMDEYVEFVESTMREANPETVARQKRIEKQIRNPFRIPSVALSRRTP